MIGERNIMKMTRKQFAALPVRPSIFDDVGPLTGLVLLPTRQRHEVSGFALIEVVAVRHGKALCKVALNSDVVALSGEGVKIDCIPKSGLLHLYVTDVRRLRVGEGLSTLDVVAERV